jgi:hypothetical protein
VIVVWLLLIHTLRIRAHVRDIKTFYYTPCFYYLFEYLSVTLYCYKLMATVKKVKLEKDKLYVIKFSVPRGNRVCGNRARCVRVCVCVCV